MPGQRKHRILLIDTDSEFLSKLFDVLVMGYEVCVIDSAAEALERILDYTPDVIILEMDLPEMDGVQFVRMLRRRSDVGNIPCIFVSHRDDEASQNLGYMVKAAKCLSKKLSLPRIVTEISRFIQHWPVVAHPKRLTIGEISREQQRQARMRHVLDFRHSEGAVPPPVVAPAALADAPDTEEPAAAAGGDGVEDVSETQSEAGLADYGEFAIRPRVLVSDGNARRVAEIQSLLGAFCDCVACCSGVDTVEKAGHYLPDVLIMNLRLPNLHGFEVSQALRQHATFAESPIMGLVDKGDPMANADVWRYGITRLFLMPDELDRLYEEIVQIACDSTFKRHAYSQTFEEVLAAEEEHRLHHEKQKANAHIIQRENQFKEFFREARRDKPR